MQPLRDLYKLLAKIEDQQKRYEQKRHNHEVGYSTKCKTCNHDQLEQIEQLYIVFFGKFGSLLCKLYTTNTQC